MTTLDELLNSLFEGNQSPFYDEFSAWVRGSRRFRAFVTAYRGKIRTKLRHVENESGLKDLRAELQTASLLLNEERFTLEYERYAALKQRGPDFTVTFRTHTPFNVEVRRIRRLEQEDVEESRAFKLMAVLCDKAGQMPPSSINLLWLTAERPITEADVNNAAATLRQLAERKAEDFFTRRGFESAAHFLKQYRQLSGIVLHQTDGNSLWLNPLARHKTPPEIITAVGRLRQ